MPVLHLLPLRIHLDRIGILPDEAELDDKPLEKNAINAIVYGVDCPVFVIDTREKLDEEAD